MRLSAAGLLRQRLRQKIIIAIRTILVLPHELICIQNVANILDEYASLLAKLSVLGRRLDLGEPALEKPIDELADLLVRRELASVEGSDNRRCLVHDD